MPDRSAFGPFSGPVPLLHPTLPPDNPADAGSGVPRRAGTREPASPLVPLTGAPVPDPDRRSPSCPGGSPSTSGEPAPVDGRCVATGIPADRARDGAGVEASPGSSRPGAKARSAERAPHTTSGKSRGESSSDASTPAGELQVSVGTEPVRDAGPKPPRTEARGSSGAGTTAGTRHGEAGTEVADCGPQAQEAGGGRPERRSADRDGEHHNEVGVAGRLTAEPRLRELPSGDHLATWRICVTRDPSTRFRGRGADSITCVSFDHELHEDLRGWRLGDVVGVRGALRRRTWRGVNGRRSVCEVEATSVRFVRARRKGER